MILVFIVGMPLLPMLVSGRWDWPEAWAYAGLTMAGFAFSRFLAVRKNSSILAERAGSMGRSDAEPFDKVLMPVVALGGLALPLVCGLDERFGWSLHYTDSIKLAALAVFVWGLVFSSWALVANPFFSGTVRIQSDRGHELVTAGPYQWVRHPGYGGGLLVNFATPVLLDAAWAFIPAVVLAAAIVVRTNLEDKILRDKLPGYEEYTRQVRFRLVPWVW
jgi:protein-S-isoprenylcysteine O-methyltransferase Ste14